MIYKKTLTIMMIFIITTMQHIQSQDVYNSQGSTALIDFIDEQDNIKQLKIKESYLWRKCIYTTSRTVGNTIYYETRIAHGASLSDLRDLYYLRQEITIFKEKISKEIDQLLIQGESFDALDNQGKTALNHVQSYEVYNVLRSKGAKFQLDSFVSMYPWYTACTSTFIIAILYKLYASGYVTNREKQAQDSNIVQNKLHHELEKESDVNSIHYRDEQKRTPLMNYLITQEETLKQIRSKINRSKYNPYMIHEYYSCMIEYQELCDKTRIQIAAMIEQGADLNVQDTHNAYLLDYCFTKEIYLDLKDAGALPKVTFWNYFSYESWVCSGLIAIPILLTISILNLPEEQITNNHNCFDTWFEKKSGLFNK